jgi:hypothetical protein
MPGKGQKGRRKKLGVWTRYKNVFLKRKHCIRKEHYVTEA